MSQGDPSYRKYQSPFTLSQPQPQAFSPYYQPYSLTQPQDFQPPNYFKNYLFYGEPTQHSQSNANASIPVEAAAPQKEKGKGRKKRAPAKQRPSVQVPEDVEFLDETDDARMHWTDADFTYLARAWENGAHKIFKGLNGGNDFKHHKAYKILVREPRWANLRDDGLNHAVNIPRNMAKRTSDNSSPENSVMKGVTASGSGVHALLDELRLEKIQAKEEKERRRVEAIQHWQAKMDLKQVNEDRKIMENDLSTLSGHQLQYYLQRQAEIMERLANRGGPGT
ncbi:hypothetical protein GIB67_038550 [Kingdonia uniflora]|uniref:No apical meristem-associated C-terminal domain-containing protein n=1 Tax=Kingdonia uniflora TaxID=39325 RepID=A0A7J7NPL4_9MAGN|nr:hypothetical protein GIB67_038550 [Kingdonia uniflora]